MPPPYRPAATAVLNPAPSPAECFNPAVSGAGPTAGPLVFGRLFLNREIYAPVRRSMNVDGSRRGVPLKKRNFVRVLSNSAPSPIVPAGKLYTTSTVLSSGEGLKKRNFVRVLSNFAPVLASPFAPGAPLSILFFLPTANCHCHCFPFSGETQTGPGGANALHVHLIFRGNSRKSCCN